METTPMTDCSNTIEALRTEQCKPIKRQGSRQTSERVIQQVLRVSQPDGLNFGSVIPGNICEEDLVLTGNTTETILVQVLVVCLNTEFEDLDEYVFSTRKVVGYDYNDKLIMALQGKQSIPLKIALKVPNIKSSGTLRGTVYIQAQGFDSVKVQGNYTIPIEVRLEIPQIVCPRMLMSIPHQMPVIRLALKIGRKVDCKVPFKNIGSVALPLEVDLLNQNPQFELMATPHSVTVQPNAQVVITFSLKAKTQSEPFDMNQILVLKVRNSSVHFSFPLCVRVY